MNEDEGELTRRVSQEHHQAVDTDTPATGRRKTVLETTRNVSQNEAYDTKPDDLRVNESLIDTLSFIITLLLLPDLHKTPLVNKLLRCVSNS